MAYPNYIPRKPRRLMSGVDEIKQLVIAYAESYAIDTSIALAQIWRESKFDPRAVGGSGERGLGQILQATWVRFSSDSFDNAFDPDANLLTWGNYMSTLLGMFGDDYSKALTAYNGGPAHLTDPGKYGPPSARAQNYAQAILNDAQQFAASVPQTTPDTFTPTDQTAPGVPEGSGISPLVWLGIGAVALVIIATR